MPGGLPAKNFRIPKRLTGKQIQAAVLVFEDKLSGAAIAEKIGISGRTLQTWKNLPEFKAEVDKQRRIFADRVELSGIALRAHRVNARNHRHQALEHVVAARRVAAQNDEELTAAGGRSGFVVRTEATKVVRRTRCESCRGFGSRKGLQCPHCGGQGYREIVEREAKFETDTGLLAAFDQLERSQAADLGQLTTKSEVKGKLDVSGTITLEVVQKLMMQLPDGELERWAEECEAAVGGLEAIETTAEDVTEEQAVDHVDLPAGVLNGTAGIAGNSANPSSGA